MCLVVLPDAEEFAGVNDGWKQADLPEIQYDIGINAAVSDEGQQLSGRLESAGARFDQSLERGRNCRMPTQTRGLREIDDAVANQGA
jgi:hypothetical protein